MSKIGIDACAELKSIAKIPQDINEEVEVHFLTSDTILSNIAFEVIEEGWDQFEEVRNIRVYPNNYSEATVKGLQVKDREKFTQEGMVNLINKIFRISQEIWDNVIINITAGYKATIPYLTILAQVFKCPIYYIFEDTDALIKIPYIPIDINWNVFSENQDFLFDLEINEIKEIPSNVKYRTELDSLLELADNLVSLNPIGIVLWEKYKDSFYLFKISPVVSDYLGNNRGREETLKKSLIELYRRLRENPDNPDLDHKLTNAKLPEDFKIFKHKEDNLQVRILYKREEYTTRYHSKDFRIYVGLIYLGQEVHNAESEYVKSIQRDLQKISNLESYRAYKIEKN
ncbi:hypothetical protein D9V84_04325 [Bacteroidetes/Chlorobi group bacterium Naka2016]|jgi:putative CRISPR-associated protein (TIGR02619 family)|nr:MAG: hypothetical protein D9V84_04325 [Bacteroidetes/Chlorobi group bacterium Naka2016]